MMKRLWIAMALVTVLGGTVEANDMPSYKNGNGLLQLCESEDAHRSMLCMGYVIGVITAIERAINTFNQKQFFCRPAETTNGQLQSIMIKYFNDNPSLLHERSMDLIIWGMTNSYPCTAKGSQ